ncbi:LysR family transcriptional regulator [Lactobacillus equicursoris]|uniref:LysR family transcriptional regulator n=1 Tax=Lactobacillus equicursoris TaxID=420645 RepID=UPI00242B20C8|nr:LysR family transcriptional regulator [Lactobacillus equicursoris]MDD6386895.1 LysR family transcriptional regulator [Lactobacillus equicursoris]
MEIQALRYFYAVAKTENMTRAASQLHVSQSTISRQLKALEEELGQKLFIRHSFSIELTQQGRLLQDQAQDLLMMADKIEHEFRTWDEVDGGDLYLGLAESYQIRWLASWIRQFKEQYPKLHYHVTSGDREQVYERLDRGVLDFGVVCEQPNPDKYSYLRLPETDTWGAVMRSDSPLAKKKKAIRVEDLAGQPLFASEEAWEHDLPSWGQDKMASLQLEGSFRLAYNGSIFVREGLGIMLTFDRLIDTSPGSGLTFVPLAPKLEERLYFTWRKDATFSPIAKRFCKYVLEKNQMSKQRNAD